MTAPGFTGLTGDETIDAALQRPLEEMRHRRRFYIAVVALVAAVTATGSIVVLTNGLPPQLILLGLFAAGSVLFAVADRFRKRMSHTVLPHVVRALGFGFRPDAGRARDLIATGLLPDRSLIRAEDWITGEIAGRRLESADIQIKTGGKNKKTMFNGLVISLANRKREDWLLLGREADTTTGFLRRPNLGLRNLSETGRVRSGSGREFLVFAPTSQDGLDAAARAFVDALMVLDGLDGCELYSVVRTYDETHVALSMQRDPHSIGGLLFSQASLQADLKAALADLNIPLEVAGHLLNAERQSESGTPPNQPA